MVRIFSIQKSTPNCPTRRWAIKGDLPDASATASRTTASSGRNRTSSRPAKNRSAKARAAAAGEIWAGAAAPLNRREGVLMTALPLLNRHRDLIGSCDSAQAELDRNRPGHSPGHDEIDLVD